MTKLQHVMSNDGVRIAYEVAGVRPPVLVFVHGRAGTRTDWRGQIAEFARSLKVVAVDLGGHGESGTGRRRWTVASFATDVASVIDHESLEQVILVGHSMGGRVIVEAAHKLPERVIGVVGVESAMFRHPYLFPSEDEKRAEIQKFQDDYAGAVRETVRAAFPPSADATLVAEITNRILNARPEVVMGAMADAQPTSSTFEITKTVKVPKFAICSDYWPVDLDAARDAGIQVIAMKGVGHFPMLEDPLVFNRHLHEAVSAISGRQRPQPD